MDKAEIANQLIERMKKPTAEANAESRDSHVRIVKAEMFKLKAFELQAVLDKNPDHPASKAYAKAVKQLGKNDEVVVEKIDLEAMLQNKEVLVSSEYAETDVEGITVPARYQNKRLGGDYKVEETTPSKTPRNTSHPNTGLNEEAPPPAEGEEKRDTFSTVGRRR